MYKSKKENKLRISEEVINSIKLSEKLMKEMRQENNNILEEKANYILKNTKKLNFKRSYKYRIKKQSYGKIRK